MVWSNAWALWIGFQLMFCFHPAHPLSLVKGLDFTYRNGSSSKSMYYPSCRVIPLGKSPKKKIHFLIHQYCSDYLCGLKPHLDAAANQSKCLGVMAVAKGTGGVCERRPRASVLHISCQTLKQSYLCVNRNFSHTWCFWFPGPLRSSKVD